MTQQKNFFQYLIESKQVYEFKIKIAGDLPDDVCDIIEAALVEYDPSCAAGTCSPIQKKHSDFPTQKNIQVSVFNVTTDYPVNTVQVRSLVADALSLTPDQLKVRTCGEDYEEYEINHIDDRTPKKAALLTPYENVDTADLYTSAQSMSLLKELDKMKTHGTVYKGVNDSLLAKSMPKYNDTVPKSGKKQSVGASSAVGSNKKTPFTMTRGK